MTAAILKYARLSASTSDAANTGNASWVLAEPGNRSSNYGPINATPRMTWETGAINSQLDRTTEPGRFATRYPTPDCGHNNDHNPLVKSYPSNRPPRKWGRA